MAAAWLGLPGCDRAAASATLRAIEKLSAIAPGTPSPEDGPVDLLALDSQLGKVWESPCLVRLSRFFRRPVIDSRETLTTMWMGGLREALTQMTGQLPPFAEALVDGSMQPIPTTAGNRFFVIPPETSPRLSSNEEQALAPWFCPDSETRCGHASTFIERFEDALDAKEAAGEAGAQNPDTYAACSRLTSGAGVPFEAWIDCVRHGAPQTYHYPKRRFRAPERGWLVLRARRWWGEAPRRELDELRAYDLVSGAAYVARRVGKSESPATGLRLNGPMRYAPIEAYTGSVEPGLLREITFLALTARAAKRNRSNMQFVLVPQGVSVDAAPSSVAHPMDYGETGAVAIMGAGSSGAYALVDDHVRGRGPWRRALEAAPVMAYADRLLDVLENGLERGCARAVLPSRLADAAAGDGTDMDAVRQQQGPLAGELETALRGLQSCGCTAMPPR